VSWVEEDELEVVKEVVVVVVDVAEESPKKCDTPIPRKMPVVRAMMLPVVVVDDMSKSGFEGVAVTFLTPLPYQYRTCTAVSPRVSRDLSHMFN